MYKTAASLIGVLVAFMVISNGFLSGSIGNTLSLPVIHMSGLLMVSLVLLFTREKRGPGKVPFYLNTGGLVGVILILTNNYCFGKLGASLTLSLGIIGQTVGSIMVDSTGFLGMEKYPFNRNKFAGLVLLFGGAVVMTDSWRGDLIPMIMALGAGALVILSMIINSRLSLIVGTFHSARRNYIAGLTGSLIVAAIARPSLEPLFTMFTNVQPQYIVGGGFLGVLIVAGSNRILPKIPVIYTSLLLFAGQAITGIVSDWLTSGTIPLNRVLGVLLILAGLVVNMLLEKKTAGTLSPQ